jgi:hypothetical protein
VPGLSRQRRRAGDFRLPLPLRVMKLQPKKKPRHGGALRVSVRQGQVKQQRLAQFLLKSNILFR